MRLMRSLFGRAGSRAVAVLLAGIVSFGAMHTSWDDVACDPFPVHHDHNAHRLRAANFPAGAQDHCLFCHSLRLLRSGLVVVHAHVSDSTRADGVRPSNIVLATAFVDTHKPSRAPPAILL
jgi:hypothetical protein